MMTTDGASNTPKGMGLMPDVSRALSEGLDLLHTRVTMLEQIISDLIDVTTSIRRPLPVSNRTIQNNEEIHSPLVNGMMALDIRIFKINADLKDIISSIEV